MASVTLEDLDALEKELGLNGHAPPPDLPDDDLERVAIRAEPPDPNPWLVEAWPFDSFRLPAFPVDALPTWLRDWSLAEAAFTQTPVDLPACLSLAATSLAVARSFHVRVRGPWVEPCNLWIVVAMLPGERKSPVYTRATDPIYAWVQAETAAKEHAVAARARDRRILEAKIKKAEAAAVDGKSLGGVDGRTLADEYQRELAALPEMRAPCLLADDCTPEALAVLLSHHGERMGIFSAEGGPFELMAGRYSDKGSNFEVFLKAHPGDPHLVNRISREPIALTHPLLTMGLTVQPSVIAGLSAREGFRGRGLLARFLYAMPQTALGKRVTDPEPMPEHVAATYKRALATLLVAHQAQRTVSLDGPADAARGAWQTALEPRLGEDGDLHIVGDWANKLVGAVARMAGVLHVADYALAPAELPDEVPAATWYRAELLGRYMLEHAMAAFNVMGQDPVTELARKLLSWCRRGARHTFTLRDAQRAMHAPAEDLSQAMATLIERGLCRLRQAPESSGGRPASPVYEVRPSVLA